MFKIAFTAAAAAAVITLPGVAAAQALLSSASAEDVRTAVVASGAKVTKVRNDDEVYIAAEASSGMKFGVEGRACKGASGKKRCDGLYIEATFDVEAAKIDDTVKKLAPQYAAVAVLANGGDGVRVSRYIILDYGVAPQNLAMNLQVFVAIADKVWNAL
ncbi:hypothetical protein [Caulobacter mirabilis]|uniref:YbjN domain-containing protein n=1 Tax=Caulobacter mirabilis TaxID=69666 RepID=A0A2D2AV25_9CAUL|nr:hypothetical protein [Caulobacter mirabilis]ATQ41860.1 hypothetical protein CSW64_05250 [Caulobacter mirabilis]